MSQKPIEPTMSPIEENLSVLHESESVAVAASAALESLPARKMEMRWLKKISFKFSLVSGTDRIPTEIGETTSFKLPSAEEIRCIDYLPPPGGDASYFERVWGDPQ